eukprot:76633-Prymnesium_polylepis.1
MRLRVQPGNETVTAWVKTVPYLTDPAAPQSPPATIMSVVGASAGRRNSSFSARHIAQCTCRMSHSAAAPHRSRAPARCAMPRYPKGPALITLCRLTSIPTRARPGSGTMVGCPCSL